MPDEINPLVSVCCITYNHEKFIADAINGFLMQKTNFPFEIIIHDDASTDSTREIISNYQLENPGLIKTIFQKENQYSQGKHVFPIAFQAARGKYIALCEGDDYWIDPDKLQKQVDFLESKPDYAICFHNNFILNVNSSEAMILREQDPWDTLTTEDVINWNSYYKRKKATPGHTSTAVFRKSCVEYLPSWCLSAFNIDVPLYIHISRYGLSKFINNAMSVWRSFPESLSHNQKDAIFLDNRAEMYKAINKEFGNQYSTSINPIISRIYLRAAIEKIGKKDYVGVLNYTKKSISYRPVDAIYILKKIKYSYDLNKSPRYIR